MLCFLQHSTRFKGIYMLIRAIAFICLLGAASVLHAQSEPTASRLGNLKVGGGFSTANSDYGGRYNGGGFGPCWTRTPIGPVWNCG